MSQPLTAEIGKRLAWYRKLNGWSAQRLADNTDGQVSRATIASVESGRRANLRLDQFLVLCLALRVPPVALLIDLDQPFAPAALRFPGPATSPLDSHAPNIAIARWLSGGGAATTPAGRRVGLTQSLISDYLAALDAVEVDQALGRTHAASTGSGKEALDRLRVATQQLAAARIQLPPEP